MGKCEPVWCVIADRGTISVRHQTTAGGVLPISVFIHLVHEAGGRLSLSVFLKPIRKNEGAYDVWTRSTNASPGIATGHG